MQWYYYIAWAAILSQLLFVLQCYCNYRYALSKYRKKRTWQQARVALIVPCKGLDPDYNTNIASFFNQDYENYLLWFVVEAESDPAYNELCRLKEQLSADSKAKDVRVFIAGSGQSCSQKVHNLLYCYRKLPADVEILAFADSDICVRTDWLSHIVYPLRQAKHGATSGYRWFVPKNNNLATLALSAVNAKVAQLLGNTPFNQAWGGSMAIRVDTFRELGIDKIWPTALSDDLSVSHAVKKAGRKVAFVPACLVASYEATTWNELFEFGRRQFLITRVYAPAAWWFGLLSSLCSVLGLYAGTIVAVYAAMAGVRNLHLIWAVPVVFLAGQFIRATLRQRMVGKLLRQYRRQMKPAMVADILACWLWSLLLLFFIISSAFGRTIIWRGIKYRLVSPTQTNVTGRSE